MSDLGGVPQLSWGQFEPYLPPLFIDISAVRASLEASGVIQDSRWSAFDANPSAISQKEDAVFKRLDGIFNAIVHQCRDNSLGRTQTLERAQNPDRVPTSNERTNTSRPDGAYIVVGSPYNWGKIGVPEEQKKFGRDAYDNTRKIIWGMHHIMRDDPCRRFTYGVTIEDTQMRVWFCNRSSLIVLKDFNFVTDVEKLIRIYSSFAFTTPAELGWDPTIRAIDGTSPTEYEIDVYVKGQPKPLVYRSAKIIWDHAAEDMHSRATRVFEAIDPDGKQVAIKDVWRDHSRESEGAAVQTVFRRLNMLGADAKKYKKYFMKVSQYGDVQIDGQTDDTFELIMHHTPLPENLSLMSLMQAPRDDEPNGNHPIVVDGLHSRVHQNTEFRRRVHHRIVFAAVGTPIHRLVRLKDRSQAMLDALTGHKILCELGYVHRDVSAGNILWTKMPNGKMVGKLTDLEYLMAIDSDAEAHGIRTGTIDFMSIEVDAMSYRFRATSRTDFGNNQGTDWNLLGDVAPFEVAPDDRNAAESYDQDEDDEDDDDEGSDDGNHHIPDDVAIVEDLIEHIEIPFRHNPINDVESFWWMMAWTFFSHIPIHLSPSTTANKEAPSTSSSSWNVDAQSRVAQEMFPGVFGSATRYDFIQSKGKFQSSAKVLPPQFQPFCEMLEKARRELVAKYGDAEKPRDGIDHSVFRRIHGPFMKLLAEIVDTAGDIEITTLPSTRSILSTAKSSGKRTADGPAGERRSKRSKTG
ncbi:hypothetical protein PLICRDRAFT_152116 [Plicaturopsis crispa FD-325 SS-3]|nr:hypothetical protein PLICRDRAFT_152116 [Plicaturopsis crispa FD-325 SS-3]